MNITVIAIGSTGDVRPCMLLGQELNKRGHQVTITAFFRFAELIENNGLLFYPIRGNVDKYMASIMEPNTNGITYLPHLWKAIKDIAPLMIEDITDSCRNADAIICSYFGSVFYSIAEMFDIPCIQIHLFPMDPTGECPIASVRNMHLGEWFNRISYKIGYFLIGLFEKIILTEWRKANGLILKKITTHPDYLVCKHCVPVIYATDPSVFPPPKDWNSSIYMTGFFFDEKTLYKTNPDLESFFKNGDTPIYIGFGSMNTGNMSKLIDIMIKSVRESGLRAVFNIGESPNSMNSDSVIMFIREVPHDWLFPRVRAVVHHGGVGTTAIGLKYGKPSLIIPFSGDQPFWAEQVRKAGCGPKPIARNHITIRNMTKALLDLTNNKTYYENARRIGEELTNRHGVLKTADLVEAEIAKW